MSKRRLGLWLMVAGLVAVLAGLAWMGYNLWDDQRAGQEAQRVQTVILQHRQEQAPTPLSADQPEEEMPTLEIDGHGYIGTLSIPALDLELPVMAEWSYSNLKLTPCRYAGSAYTNDMVICAHNYTTHFGRLKNLRVGDAVTFTAIDGTAFSYLVDQVETLASTAIEEMTVGDWALTLFTCTMGGQARVAVRCQPAQ